MKLPPTRHRGKRALVTGAGKGIGHAIAVALVDSGAEVTGIDQTWDSDCAFTAKGGTALTHDLSAADVDQVARHSLTHGPFDLIVNNVGFTTRHRFLELSPEDFDRVMAVNLRTPWFLTLRLVEALREEGRGGSILFISSLHSEFLRLFPHYSASKAGISMLARELAHELAPDFRVNVISPGWIDTGPEPPAAGFVDKFESLIPLGRRGRPEDVAPLALALLDDSISGYVTGADIRIDGGLALHTWMDDVGPAPFQD